MSSFILLVSLCAADKERRSAHLAYFADLTPYRYFASESDSRARNVGWLAARMSLNVGILPRPLSLRLMNSLPPLGFIKPGAGMHAHSAHS